MAKIQPRSFKGTRDFAPVDMIPRENMIERLKASFRLYGFSPLETPALEMLEVLSGKYGDEGEKLLYKLDYKNDTFRDRVALRYDLTVPLARVVASNPSWPMPFKRYQVQPVWRADKPQPHQGRFREFYQCDVDTIGAPEGTADAEIIALSVSMLQSLGFGNGDKRIEVLVNHRKLLEALTRLAGRPREEMPAFCRALDKLDKIGESGVREELEKLGVDQEGFARLDQVFALDTSDYNAAFDSLETLLQEYPEGLEGIGGLRAIFRYLEAMDVDMDSVRFDPYLARGLDYYTGAVFESVLPEHRHIGSLSGGGRYDELIGLYSGRDLPAVGTTIGLDRIFAAMQQLQMLETGTATVVQVLVAAWSDEELEAALLIAGTLRRAGIPTDIFPATGKLKKPFSYADKLNIPFVAVVGPDEIADPSNLKVSLKDLSQGSQDTLTLGEAIQRVRKHGELE